MLEDVTSKITLTQRSNFSVQHIMSAARFARQCFRIEEEHQGKPLGSFYDEIISYTTATVFSSVASLEANINEIYADVLDNFYSIGEYNHNFLVEFWDLIEEKSILEKYQFLLVMKGKSKLDKGVYEFQAVDTLIKSRNALVHFKPEWQHEQADHGKVGKQLMGKFELSPFVSENAPIFPSRCMTHGFAEWAVDSTIIFVKWYSALAEIPYRFQNFLMAMSTR